jgi:hypothetical protein
MGLRNNDGYGSQPEIKGFLMTLLGDRGQSANIEMPIPMSIKLQPLAETRVPSQGRQDTTRG